VQNSCDTVYPRNMACFSYISVNTLHKDDDDDDDDDDDNYYFSHLCINLAITADKRNKHKGENASLGMSGSHVSCSLCFKGLYCIHIPGTRSPRTILLGLLDPGR
jgi:hypothetical protein